MIGDVFPTTTGSAARSIYLALAEIASDKQSETFDASQSDIAHRASLSVATVKRILPTLRQVGLVTIERKFVNKIETRSTYTIMRGALAHHERALVQPPKTKRATEEESSEESFERAARMKDISGSNTGEHSLAERHGFNPKTGEYEWDAD